MPRLDISAVNQLWVADITYLRLLREFVYLAVVLDAFSRRVIGGSLGRTLEAELALAALRTALADTRDRAGLGASLRPRRAVRRGPLHEAALTGEGRLPAGAGINTPLAVSRGALSPAGP